MDLGLLLGFENSLETLLELAREGEAAGLAGMYNAEAGRSAFVPATAIASVTERVRVGTYVVNAYAREPWATGISARDVDEFSGGRFVLGVGTGNLHFNNWYMNLDSSKPLAKMRDYVSILRAVVAGGPEKRFDTKEKRIGFAGERLGRRGAPRFRSSCRRPGRTWFGSPVKSPTALPSA